MSHSEIKRGAVFVADSHVNKKRDNFFEFLKSIDEKRIDTSQLFLMGDIFDLLVGGVEYTQKINQKYINLINKISKKVEIFYFEGNHDFNLKKIFPNIKVFSYKDQPAVFKMNNYNVLLLHGDKATPFLYTVYTKIIRSKIFLFTISIVDNFLNGFISKKIIRSQYKKDICKKIDNFKDIVQTRMAKLLTNDIDIIIEGHFHQNVTLYIKEDKKYINISSFACNKSFIIVQSQSEFQKVKFKKDLPLEKGENI